jgi:hypothetical protein
VAGSALSSDQLFEDASKFNGGYVGYPTLCSSFYQKRDESYPQCNDILSTIGVDYTIVCDKTNKPNPVDYECGVDENGKSVGNCYIDITQMDGIKGMLCRNCMSINKSYRDPYNCVKHPEYNCTQAAGKQCVKCENTYNSPGWVCCTTTDGNADPKSPYCRDCPAGCKSCDYDSNTQKITCNV